MSITYDECVVILNQFTTRFPWVQMQPEVHGLQVGFATPEETQITLQILVLPNVQSVGFQTPESFDYTFVDQERSIAVQVRPAQIVLFRGAKAILDCKVKGGHSARHAEGLLTGTVGWNVYFRQQRKVVAISCWHILCGRGNDTPIPSAVYLNGLNLADLHAKVDIYPDGYINTWDYALAAYHRNSDACAAMNECADYDYPQRLTPRSNVRVGDMHYKVGLTSGCTEGRLLNVGRRVTTWYSEGGPRYWFNDQLVFEDMTSQGDSGAVIVRKEGNTVTGLHMSGGDVSVANPFFDIGWTYRGSILIHEGAPEIPMFDGDFLPQLNADAEFEDSRIVIRDSPDWTEPPGSPAGDDKEVFGEPGFWLAADDDWVGPEVDEGLLFTSSESEVVEFPISRVPDRPLNTITDKKFFSGYSPVGHSPVPIRFRYSYINVGLEGMFFTGRRYKRAPGFWEGPDPPGTRVRIAAREMSYGPSGRRTMYLCFGDEGAQGKYILGNAISVDNPGIGREWIKQKPGSIRDVKVEMIGVAAVSIRPRFSGPERVYRYYLCFG